MRRATHVVVSFTLFLDYYYCCCCCCCCCCCLYGPLRLFKNSFFSLLFSCFFFFFAQLSNPGIYISRSPPHSYSCCTYFWIFHNLISFTFFQGLSSVASGAPLNDDENGLPVVHTSLVRAYIMLYGQSSQPLLSPVKILTLRLAQGPKI